MKKVKELKTALAKAEKKSQQCTETFKVWDNYLINQSNTKVNQIKEVGEQGNCKCGHPNDGKQKVDLVILIDTSGSMQQKADVISKAAVAALPNAQKNCPNDLRVEWFGIEGTFSGTNFTQTSRNYLLSKHPGATLVATPGLGSGSGPSEEGADSITDLCNYLDWREGACRAIFYISDEPLDLGAPQNAADDTATTLAINTAINNDVTVFTHLVKGGYHTNPGTIKNYEDICLQTGGKPFIANPATVNEYTKILEEVVCQACGRCKEVCLPKIKPCISISWGDSECDHFETNDFEILYLTVCNCFSNIVFSDFTIGYVEIVDCLGNEIPLLPDGRPSIEVLPQGPVCFGDILPCSDNEASCKSRQIILRTTAAKAGDYAIKLKSICYNITYNNVCEKEFKIELCKD